MKNPELSKWWQPLVISFKHAFDSMPTWLKNILVSTIIFVILSNASVYFFGDKYVAIIAAASAEKIQDEALNLTDAQKDKVAEINVDVKQREKSIISDQASHVAYMNSIFRREIQNDFNSVHVMFPGCTGVSYWTVHNGGETTKINIEAVMEFHISSNLKNEMKFGDKAPPIYNGFRWLADELIIVESNQIYVKDLNDFPEINIGRTKAHLEDIGTKSFYAAMVKNEGTVQHFVSMDFKVINPREAIPGSFEKFKEIKESVEKRLFYGNNGLD